MMLQIGSGISPEPLLLAEVRWRTQWCANSAAISAVHRRLSTSSNVITPKKLVGIPQYIVAHHRRFETPDLFFRSHQHMGADQAKHGIKLRDKFLYSIVSALSLVVVKH